MKRRVLKSQISSVLHTVFSISGILIFVFVLSEINGKPGTRLLHREGTCGGRLEGRQLNAMVQRNTEP